MSDREKRVVAYHEAGHALVGHVLPNTDPIHKVSIIARGRALGWTLSLPQEDRYLKTRSELRDQLTMLLGGRTAEEVIFGDPTTGAADDIERATQIARAMVTKYGMSERIGLQQLGRTDGEVFLGKEMAHEPDYSDDVAGVIDDEVRVIIDAAHNEAQRDHHPAPLHPRPTRRHARRAGDRRGGRDRRPLRRHAEVPIRRGWRRFACRSRRKIPPVGARRDRP